MLKLGLDGRLGLVLLGSYPVVVSSYEDPDCCEVETPGYLSTAVDKPTLTLPMFLSVPDEVDKALAER
jgi:hypothetical protein